MEQFIAMAAEKLGVDAGIKGYGGEHGGGDLAGKLLGNLPDLGAD